MCGLRCGGTNFRGLGCHPGARARAGALREAAKIRSGTCSILPDYCEGGWGRFCGDQFM